MNTPTGQPVNQTSYDLEACEIGVVHLGYGAFHRAHQAQYIDDYMDITGDLRWGIAAVNLRGAEAESFAEHQTGGYLLKSMAPGGETDLRRVRSHIHFSDWTRDAQSAESLLALASVHMVTITVTEGGYYTDNASNLNAAHPVIAAELAGGQPTSVYGYLMAALSVRMHTSPAPLTICCCDNIRQNGKMLRRNLAAYLALAQRDDLAEWVKQNVRFPCSMVDRITPRPTQALARELHLLTGQNVVQPVMAEAFVQWVLEDNFAGPMPDLAKAGVTVTRDVDPYEETKIRVLNGGHTCLTYLAALHGIDTFDAAMRMPELSEHFSQYEELEVLPALTLELPFSKQEYLGSITERFGNRSIADTVARICADGWAKFPIFIRPTLEGCLQQGKMPLHGIKSIASWHCFCQHAAAGRIGFDYAEPGWAQLSPLIGTDDFVMSRQLWGDLPTTYPEFADAMRSAIKEMEQTWPV